uniref:Small ribosomal subunit protein uS4c n=1 Tax=Netrium digitus TaxID=43946 RepID=A0A191T574_9VIRI|nr:ribosomal protein S4 [Netrium digitus]ANI25539.1 ribosomal protein S4 [Netrium digitus]
MSRYRGPRVKIVRRLGTLLGLTSKVPKSKPKNRMKSVRKKKPHLERLEQKQRLRFHYGITENQLLRYVRIARRAKGSTGQVLLQLLEMRLDNTIFRLGIAPTIPAARQLVNHGHITVNARVVDIPSYRCRSNDIIAAKDRPKSRALIDTQLNEAKQYKIPNHLSINSTNCTASVKHLVNRDSIGVQVNELLVVEYYSRQV